MREATRRGFLMGCSSAIAGLAAARFTGIALAGTGVPADRDVLVVLFLRGGLDGLSLVLPTAGPDRGHYVTARTNLLIPSSGANAALPLRDWAGNAWGLHPAATALHELWQDRRVAFIHACGMDTPSRSHFDTQTQIELGTPGVSSTPDGWLTRHFLTAPGLDPGAVIPKLSVSSTIQTAWQSDLDVVAMTDPGDFELNTGPSEWRALQKIALRNILENPVFGGEFLHATGIEALDASTLVESLSILDGTYTPSNGAVYPSGGYGDALELVARMIKADLGLQAVTLDLGGWDTHNGQNGPGAGNYLHERISELSRGLAALYTDLDGPPAQGTHYTSRLTVVVMSEFGRRVRENADRGTDHGHGNVVTVLGNGVSGGLYGSWPGLAPEQLYDGADLAVTTDFRRVLTEILIQRLANPNWAEVFPGYVYPGPLGFTQIFNDGFESGDTSAWS